MPPGASLAHARGVLSSSFLLLQVGGSIILLKQLSFSHSINMVRHTALGLSSHLIPPPCLHGREGSFCPGFVPSNDIVDSRSVLGIKSGDSCYDLIS